MFVAREFEVKKALIQGEAPEKYTEFYANYLFSLIDKNRVMDAREVLSDFQSFGSLDPRLNKVVSAFESGEPAKIRALQQVSFDDLKLEIPLSAVISSHYAHKARKTCSLYSKVEDAQAAALFGDLETAEKHMTTNGYEYEKNIFTRMKAQESRLPDGFEETLLRGVNLLDKLRE